MNVTTVAVLCSLWATHVHQGYPITENAHILRPKGRTRFRGLRSLASRTYEALLIILPLSSHSGEDENAPTVANFGTSVSISGQYHHFLY